MARTRCDRREFMGLSAASVAGLLAPPWAIRKALAAVDQDPDLVVHNAKIYTVDPVAPRAEAFAVKSGRFVAVGSSDEVKALIGKRTRTFDARQMTVVPGFVDAHNHAPGTILRFEVLVGNPYEVEFVTIESIVEKLRARARETPPGFWVEGFFFDDTKLKDKRALDVRDLDRVSTDHPVSVRHRGGHTTFYNSRALALAGIGKDTPNTKAGTFDRRAGGELNGRVTDRARLVFAEVGMRPTYSAEETHRRNRDGLAFISKQFARYGLTSVHHEGGDLLALQEVRARGELRHRVSYEPMEDVLEAMIANGIATGFGDEWIRLGATSEHTCDGSFSERTMAMSTPYEGVEPAYYGNLLTNQADLDAWVERVHRAGIEINCHANGDVTIDMVLTALERAQRVVPRPEARPKITHCTLINDDLVRRIKAAGAVPALFTSYAYYNSDKFVFYGEELMKRSMAFRTLLNAGVWVAAGSDFSPGPFDPRMAIQGMVTRTGWD
ncbi:MAG: amidohydrolase, partial [Xanthobacteraceae bacterium]|nr:amidohydrolase [Xanthobacteraceae bacterium]